MGSKILLSKMVIKPLGEKNILGRVCTTNEERVIEFCVKLKLPVIFSVESVWQLYGMLYGGGGARFHLR